MGFNINDYLEQIAQTVFTNCVGEYLTADHTSLSKKLPKGWKIGNLTETAIYTNGLAMQKFRPKQDEYGLPVLKIKELRQGHCDKESERCSNQIDNVFIVDDGDVVFSWSGTLLVDIWCGGKAGLNQHLFKVTSATHNKWFYYLWTKWHLENFIAIAVDKTTTMGHIKREHLEKALVLIPDSKTYGKISSILNPVIDLVIQSRVQSRSFASIRDALLPKLISGEIDVSEVKI